MTRKRRKRKSPTRRRKPSAARRLFEIPVYIALAVVLLSNILVLIIGAVLYILMAKLRPRRHRKIIRFLERRSVIRTWSYKKQLAALVLVFLFVNAVTVGRNPGSPLRYLSIGALDTRTAAVGLLGVFYALSPLTRPDLADVSVLVARASAKYGIERNLIYGFIEVESGFRTTCISDKGACGLMQLMPATAWSLLVFNVFHPARNIDGGTRYIRKLLDRFNGNLKMAIAAYNVGPGRVARSRGFTAEMNTYYSKVIGARNRRAGGRS